MTEKVTDIGSKRKSKETTLCMCVQCKHHWVADIGMRDRPPRCPECDSSKTIIDQLWEIPTGHTILTCHCGNKYYKLCKTSDGGIYWMCAACGSTSIN